MANVGSVVGGAGEFHPPDVFFSAVAGVTAVGMCVDGCVCNTEVGSYSHVSNLEQIKLDCDIFTNIILFLQSDSFCPCFLTKTITENKS